MRSINVNVSHLVAALSGERPLNLPVGNGKDSLGNFVTVFIDTDKETGVVVLHGSKQDRVKLNFRASR